MDKIRVQYREYVKFCFLTVCQQTHLLITLQPYICPIVCNPIGLIPLHFDINKPFLSSEYVSHRLDIAA